jgi:hypothetical protein
VPTITETTAVPSALALHDPASAADPPAPVPEGGWRVAGAAVRGVSHERTDTPCQDAQGYRLLGDAQVPGGALLVALADGAGSASHSEQSAALAVDSALREMAMALVEGLPETTQAWKDLLCSTFRLARQEVVMMAEERGVSLREYACTLTCVITTGNVLAVGQIGDGAVVAAGEDGTLFAATRLQRGEYANETHFLVQEDALEQAVIDIYERAVCSLAVMSDGLIRLALKMPSQEPHAPFFQPLFGFIRAVEDGPAAEQQLSAFLSSERVNSRTDDDKSLVLAANLPCLQREPQPAPVEDPPSAVGKNGE